MSEEELNEEIWYCKGCHCDFEPEDLLVWEHDGDLRLGPICEGCMNSLYWHPMDKTRWWAER